MRFDIITFGSAVVDIFLDTDISEEKSSKGKRVMVYPVGSKILLNNLKIDIGGGGTNSAVAFSRLGFKTGFIGKLGGDNYGKEILNLLKKEKIKFIGKIEKKSFSGYSIILDSKQNNRTILTYKGINDEVDFGDIPKNLSSDWLYLSTLMKKSFKTQKKIAKEFKEKGTKIAFNPTEYLIKKEDIFSLLGLCDIVVLNKEEAELITKNKDKLKGIYFLGPKIVVITDGENKVFAYNGKKKYSFQPKKVMVVEKTGAGDAFASGFVAGQILGKTIEESLELGFKESKSVIKHFGAKNNLIKKSI